MKQNIEKIPEKISISDQLANFSNDLFDNGNINKLPFREHKELEYYTENKSLDFDNFLKNHLIPQTEIA